MKLTCPYDGADVIRADSVIVYKTRSFGRLYICSNYPKCDAYVGMNKRTGKPLGTLANAELRAARKKAHAAFDPRWQKQLVFGGADNRNARTAEYKWLSEKLGVPLQDCHIGMFDLTLCHRVVEACK